jgi:hypothetical protein
MPPSILMVNIFAIHIRSSSDPSFTSTIGMSFMAVGPHGIMQITSHSIGSSPRIDVLDANSQTTEMEIAGQSTNRVMSTRAAGSQGTLPPLLLASLFAEMKIRSRLHRRPRESRIQPINFDRLIEEDLV